jgi:hypothetical protein
MRDSLDRCDLAVARTDLTGDLSLHDLPRDQRDRLTNEIVKTPITHTRNDISNRHALLYDHRGVSF